MAGGARQLAQAGRETNAGAFRAGQTDILFPADPGRVDPVRQAAQRVHASCVGQGQGFLVAGHGIFARFGRAGTGQDIVELVEQHLAPGRLERTVDLGQGRRGLRFQQRLLGQAVATLDPRLGRVAAIEDEIALAGGHGQPVLDFFSLAEKVVERAEAVVREDRPAVHRPDALEIAAGRPAAVVTHAVDAQG